MEGALQNNNYLQFWFYFFDYPLRVLTDEAEYVEHQLRIMENHLTGNVIFFHVNIQKNHISFAK